MVVVENNKDFFYFLFFVDPNKDWLWDFYLVFYVPKTKIR